MKASSHKNGLKPAIQLSGTNQGGYSKRMDTIPGGPASLGGNKGVLFRIALIYKEMVPLQGGPWRERGGELEVLDWPLQSKGC